MDGSGIVTKAPRSISRAPTIADLSHGEGSRAFTEHMLKRRWCDRVGQSNFLDAGRQFGKVVFALEKDAIDAQLGRSPSDVGIGIAGEQDDRQIGAHVLLAKL